MKNLFLLSKILLFLISTLISISSSAQSPYELTYQKDIPLMAGVLGTILTRKHFQDQVRPLTETEIGLLNKNKINRFDRSAVDHYSASARTVSDLLKYGSYAFPFALAIDKPMRKEFLTIALIGLETHYWNTAFTIFAKVTAKRSRPFLYNPDVKMEEKLLNSGRFSFYSGHTTTVTSFSFFTAKVFADYHPNSKWKPVIWTAATLVSGTTGYMRYKGGKHFPTDVIMGMAAGAMIGVLIPQLHKKKNHSKKVDLSFFPNGEKIGFVMRW